MLMRMLLWSAPVCAGQRPEKGRTLPSSLVGRSSVAAADVAPRLIHENIIAAGSRVPWGWPVPFE